MTDPLYTLAFPRLTAPDRRWIDRIRSAHDPNAGKVAPHFTLLFGIAAISEADYLAHVARVARSSGAIPFHCRGVSLAPDPERDAGYVFLIPDQGNGGLLALHDRLYSGAIAAHLRPDLAYVPHLTLGRLGDHAQAGALCDALNRARISIAGLIDGLTVVSDRGDRIEKVAGFDLAAPGRPPA